MSENVNEIDSKITFYSLCSGVEGQIEIETAIAQALNSPKMNWLVLMDQI